MRRLFALLLLALFGLGLWAGPHPCAASQGEEESARPSCHETSPPAGGPEARAATAPQGDGQSCCDTFCQHVCHMTAVAANRPITFAIAPVSQAVGEAPVSVAPLFAQPIDHIPLA